MHIGIAIGLFIVSYLIQLLLCFKAKSTQTKLIPFYFGLTIAFLGFMFYAEIFGNMTMGMLGNGHGFVAVIIWIAVLIIYIGLLLAKVTHSVVKYAQRRNVK